MNKILPHKVYIFIGGIFMRRFICFLVVISNIFCVAFASNIIPNKIELDLDCKSAILLDATTGTILYEKNSHEQLRPASVTKVMTLLLTMEATMKLNKSSQM